MALIKPHSGKLVNRFKKSKNPSQFKNLKKLVLNDMKVMDVEQIALGGFSPVEGFFCSDDLQCVMDNMRLVSGDVWTLPLSLDVNQKTADTFSEGDEISLFDKKGNLFALFNLEEKYKYDKKELVHKIYGTDSLKHAGVKQTFEQGNILLGGKITLLERPFSEFRAYELTPAETRSLFMEKKWNKVLGFHTRNVIHRSHEFIQLQGLEKKRL
ncbi:MAG: hypothetical protein V1672_02380 [Candidatus Diapherotrites archaeon]